MLNLHKYTYGYAARKHRLLAGGDDYKCVEIERVFDLCFIIEEKKKDTHDTLMQELAIRTVRPIFIPG